MKNLVENDNKMLDVDRDDLTCFLSGTTSTQSLCAVVGILRQKTDTMKKNLDESVATENEAIKTYDELGNCTF